MKKAEVAKEKKVCCYCGRTVGVRNYLKDRVGRGDRPICEECAKERNRKPEQMKDIIRQAEEYLKETFEIELPEKLVIQFASAKKLHALAEKDDHRTVLTWVSTNPGRKMRVLVENGAPQINTIAALVRALTQVWQSRFLQFDGKDPDRERLYREGHATYMEVRYLLDSGNRVMARIAKKKLKEENDIYAQGFRKVMEELCNDIQNGNPFDLMLQLFPQEKREEKENQQPA